MDNSACIKCSHRLLMPVGGLWCSLVMKPISLISECSDFEAGSGQIYKITPMKIPKKVTKVKMKEEKPKPIIKSKGKIKPEAPRLF